MILLDTNIFIDAHGRPHLYKEPSWLLLEGIGEAAPNYNIDVELLQEILHVYDFRGTLTFGLELFDVLADLFPNPFPIDRSEIVLARQVLGRFPALSPRDAIHAAVVFTQHLEGIVTTDGAFTQVSGLTIYDPITLVSEQT